MRRIDEWNWFIFAISYYVADSVKAVLSQLLGNAIFLDECLDNFRLLVISYYMANS